MTLTTVRIPVLSRLAAAVVSALAVALSALVAVTILFFGGNAANLPQLIEFFVAAMLCTFVMLAVFALVGMYGVWYLRLVGGLFAGVVGAFLGALLTTIFTAASGGPALSADTVQQLVATLLGPNLPFVVTTTILTMTVGYSLWRRLTATADVAPRRIALVRAPADSLASGQVTYIERSDVDVDLANTQWDSYVATLSNAGWDIVEVPAADDSADSVFVEDTMVIFGDLAIIASPGTESRLGEIAAAEKSAKELGLTIARIELPGTLDGGDVLTAGETVYVGRGSRTNAEGVRQLRSLLDPLGYTVVAVPVSKALHLKSAATALPDGTVIGYLPLIDDPSVFGRFLAMPEAEGAAVVVLAVDTVLMSSAAPLSIALVENLGYRVLTADISEFEKLEGCVTCLSVRIR